MKCLLVLVLFGLVGCALAEKVDPEVWEKLKTSETTNVLVKFVGANLDESYAKLDALGDAFGLTGAIDRTTLLENMVKIFKTQANLVQKPVIDALKVTGIEVKSNQLWITGELIIHDATKACIEALANNPAVQSVSAEKFFEVSADSQEKTVPTKIQWGIEKINAPYAWEKYKTEGENVVVGIMDTGALYTHEALRENYRGWKGENVVAEHDYNWLDAGAIICDEIPSKEPVDIDGHGTHVVGTVCGNVNNIGVVPKAKWVACRGGEHGFSNQALLLCGQFFLCPTDLNNENEDCSKAANVINNSWGNNVNGEKWYDDMVRAWDKAGIVSFFAAGNNGTKCGNVGSPASSKNIIAVGSTTEEDDVSSFSSGGPSVHGVMKPDFSAPGSYIVSASITSDNEYTRMSGTSMASPHAAGLAALIVGYFKKNNMKYTVDDVINSMKDGAQPIQPTMQTCNGTRDDTYPNNVVGFGRIDAKVSLSEDVISKYGTKATETNKMLSDFL